MKKLDKLHMESVVDNEFTDQKDVWTELVGLNSTIQNLMKKFGIGYKIKTFGTEKGATSKTRKILQKILTSGKVESPGKLQQQIKDEVVKYKDGKPTFEGWEVERIARTEAKNMQTVTKLLRWKEMGVKKVKWKTKIDDTTGKEDRDMNNRVIGIDKALADDRLRPPLHPNCRCSFIVFS